VKASQLFFACLLVSPLTYGQVAVKEFTKEVIPSLNGQFIENKGQIVDQNGKARPDVKYVFCAPGFKAAFMENGISYELYKNEAEVTEHAASYQKGSSSTPSPTVLQVNRIDISFGNSKPANMLVQGRSEAFLTYHIAPNLEPGINDVHGYKKLVYKNVWPNIDLEFSADESGFLKYNIVVHPGGDLRYVGFRYDGADITHLPNSLRLSTSQGVIQESIPHSFLKEDGAPVAVQYNAEHNVVGFDANYDRSKTLVIDPVLAWDSTVASGVVIAHFCRDSKGNLYFTGKSSTASYVVTSGAYQSSISGGTDAFLVKMEPSRAISWGTLYGSSSNDEALKVACNDSLVYIFGITSTTSGLATSNAYQKQSGGGKADVYFVKFLSNGNLVWGTYFGDTLTEWITGAGCDKVGNVYFAGLSSDNFDDHMMQASFTGAGQKISSSIDSRKSSWYASLSMDKNRDPLYSWTGMTSWGNLFGGASGKGGVYTPYNMYNQNIEARGIWGDSAGRVYWLGGLVEYKLHKFTSDFRIIKVFDNGIVRSGDNNIDDLASDKWSNIYVLANGYVIKYDSASNELWRIYCVKPGWGGGGSSYYAPAIVTGLYRNFYILENSGRYIAEYYPSSDLKILKSSVIANICPGNTGNISIDVRNAGDYNVSKAKIELLISGPDTLQYKDSLTKTVKPGGIVTFTFSLPGNLKEGKYKVLAWLVKDLANASTVGDTVSSQFDVRSMHLKSVLSDTVICANDFISFSDSTSTSNDSVVSVKWQIGSDVYNVKQVKVAFPKPGVYKIGHTVTTIACSAFEEKTVSVHSKAIPGFTTNIVNNCGKSVLFANKTDSAGENIVTYNWDFGDGEHSVDASPNHTYKKGGTYKVTLMANSYHRCDSVVSKIITVYPIPEPDFDWSNACYGVTTTFNNRSSIDSGFAINNYQWKFGDGTTSFMKNPTHIYSAMGNYTVTLILTSNKGCRDSLKKTLAISSFPKADFSATDVCFGTPVKFTDSSTISQGTISKYLWNFDGKGTSTAQNPSYIFSSAGTYKVRLIVENSGGCQDSITKSVIVFALPSTSFSKKTSGYSVSFSVSDSTLSSYSWDFGDGKSSTVKNPVHTYGATGTYTVKLKVTNANGCDKTVSDTVNIKTIGIDEEHASDFHVTVYPNPFTNSTTLEYELTKPAKTEARLYDMQGKEIAIITKNSKQSAGKYMYEISADKLHLKAGTYLIRLVIDGEVRNEQVIRVK
jgi:PKD repeat protein